MNTRRPLSATGRTSLSIRCAWLLGLLSIAISGPLYGQSRFLSVTSNAPGASIWVDGAWMGYVGQQPYSVPISARNVIVRPLGDEVWSVDPLRFTLEPDTGHVVLDAHFSYHYHIQSIPSGATVFLDQQNLGKTPIVHQSAAPVEEDFHLEMEGYQEARIRPGQNIWNPASVEMTPVTDSVEGLRGIYAVEKTRPNWTNLAAAAVAFSAGVLAIHYRTKADNRYQDYLQTGSASLRADIRRLDVQSGVALGTMQAGLGFVAIRLAL
jgi:hypothetical protein